MNPKSIISKYLNPFWIQNPQSLGLIFPLERGNFQVEFVSMKEIQFAIKSHFNFNGGEIITTSSSEFPSNIKLNLNPGILIPNFSFGTTIYNDDRRPFKVKSAYHYEKEKFSFIQGINITFNVLPTSLEAIDPSFIDIKTKTDMMNKSRTKYFSFGYKSDKQKIKFEGIIKNLIKRKYLIETGINYSFRNYTLKNSRLYMFSNTKLGQTDLSAIYLLKNSSLNFTFQRNIDDYVSYFYNFYLNSLRNRRKNQKKIKNKAKKSNHKIFKFSRNNLLSKNITAGLLLGINHIFQPCYGPKFTGKVSTKFDIDKDSSFHFIFGIHGEFASKFSIVYNDFINLQFTWTSLKGMSSDARRENKYGAAITFDFCKRK